MNNKLKVAYCSDLHLDQYVFFGETMYPDLSNTEGADVLIIAGDMCEYINLRDHIHYVQKLSTEYKHIILVEGNHEWYYTDVNQVCEKSVYPENVHLLDNESIVIDGVTFFGGTLWADIETLSRLDKFAVTSMVSDFEIIGDGDKAITPEKIKTFYNDFIERLIEVQLETSDNSRLIVVSHFAPSLKSVTSGYENSPLNPYFCNDLDELIEKSDISIWIHGHTHSNHDYMIGNTRILCNPRGYAKEGLHNNYRPKFFEI